MMDYKGKVILMSENGTKRIRRTPEERIAEIDAKNKTIVSEKYHFFSFAIVRTSLFSIIYYKITL